LYADSFAPQSAGSFGTNQTFSITGLFVDGFTVMSFQDSRIPPEVNWFIIAPLNLFALGTIVFLIRGGGS
jgi:hypothetical protein